MPGLGLLLAKLRQFLTELSAYHTSKFSFQSVQLLKSNVYEVRTACRVQKMIALPFLVFELLPFD